MSNKRPTYSHSRLQTFENCPLQYKFKYIDRIKSEEEGIEAFLGKRFHEAMEKLYGDMRYKILTLDELLDYFDEQWEKNYSEDIVIVKKNRTKEDYYNLCKECIKNYYQRYYPFNSSKLIALEKYVKINLDDYGNYQLGGYIDRLSQREDGTYEIHDYKTSGSLPEQEKIDNDRQLALYQLGVQNLWNDVEKVELIWHYVVFDKEIVSRRSNEQLEELKKETIALIDRIENTEEFLPNESALCDWCTYQDLCPLKKHKTKLESLPVNEYLADDGVNLVNTYVKLKKEISDREAELNKVKEAVFAYAEREGISVICGSDKQLKISQTEGLSVPSKKSEERKKLEEIIRSAGKWNEVSTLDNSALKDKLKADKWDKGLVDEIKKFITPTISKRISISTLRRDED
ncbi:MAG: PD-(D/E)XK nuclease family protein [Candidatus Schekmanbacteria bacterium]|nr:MAG: PD-(D/E)XK nuclease family protein [Candidatus Schekmanbacteria bacterium]